MDLTPVLALFPTLLDAHGRHIDGPQTTTLPVTPISDGLINDTFALGDAHIVQRLHPIFRAEVNADIVALTAPLRRAGVPVPRLVPAADGQPFVSLDGPEGLAGVWRVMTRLPGRTHHRVTGPAMAAEAAALLARFHGALLESQHDFAFSRPGAHDTDAHMATLADAVARHSDHRLHAQVAPLADELQRRWQDWGRPPALPRRVIHGDPKISNILFDDAGLTTGLIDLDTMAWGSVDLDLGDALRSWGNAADESDPSVRFAPEVAVAAIERYRREAPWLTEPEREALLPAAERITLELAARFAADALAESYFGWDPRVAPARGEHNLLRARNQLTLARDIARQRPDLEARLRRP